jgi:hypothetical protein
MKNNNTIKGKEWLSLDDYVSGGKSDLILYVRIKGESMPDVGINIGDLIVVDRIRQPVSTDVVLSDFDGVYSIVKFSDLKNKQDAFEIVGVVTYALKKFSAEDSDDILDAEVIR